MGWLSRRVDTILGHLLGKLIKECSKVIGLTCSTIGGHKTHLQAETEVFVDTCGCLLRAVRVGMCSGEMRLC